MLPTRLRKHKYHWKIVWAALMVVFGLLAPLRTHAASIIAELNLPASSGPISLTTGPDNNIWFTGAGGDYIGRMTPSGTVTQFALPSAGQLPMVITPGPDGNLWFTLQTAGAIGKITPSGTITEYPLGDPVSREPIGIVAGPDGNLWFALSKDGTIGRITPSGVITRFTASGQPTLITAGPDGNLWFTDQLNDKIGKITMGGVVTEYALPQANSLPTGIATGPDGNLWFAEQAGRIGKITPSGTITEYSLAVGVLPSVIIAGLDGKLWFNDLSAGGNAIMSLDTSGNVVDTLPIPTANAYPYGLAMGPDNNIWFTQLFGNKIGYVTESNGGVSPSPTSSPSASPSPTVNPGGETPLQLPRVGAFGGGLAVILGGCFAAFAFLRHRNRRSVLTARVISAARKIAVEDELQIHHRLPVDTIGAPDDQA